MKLSKKLTIVIPCKNESRYIEKTLQSLHDQCGTNDVRVIVADCSTDNTRNTIEQFSETHDRLKIEIIDGGLPSLARNNGANLTTTDLILFLDADMWFEDHYHLYKELKYMNDNDLDLLTCKFRTSSFFYNLSYGFFDMVQKYISRKEPFAVGGYMLFKRKAFVDNGGFDEKVLVAEDFDLSRKIKPLLFKITHRFIYTSHRRLKNKGVLWMSKLMIKMWLNRNNKSYYRNDHGYWS